TNGLDDPGEQLTRLADEGQALLVLVGARRFAHEHQLGVRTSLPEDDVLAAARELERWQSPRSVRTIRKESSAGCAAGATGAGATAARASVGSTPSELRPER